jgi:hypothetical protein
MTNVQSMRPKNWPVDTRLVKRLLIRLMTRNTLDRTEAMLQRAQLTQNFQTLDSVPEAHLGNCMQIIDRAAHEGRPTTFEAGLVFGVTMTLAARGVNGRGMLEQMLADIQVQQELPPEERPANAVKPQEVLPTEPEA